MQGNATLWNERAVTKKTYRGQHSAKIWLQAKLCFQHAIWYQFKPVLITNKSRSQVFWIGNSRNRLEQQSKQMLPLVLFNINLVSKSCVINKGGFSAWTLSHLFQLLRWNYIPIKIQQDLARTHAHTLYNPLNIIITLNTLLDMIYTV